MFDFIEFGRGVHWSDAQTVREALDAGASVEAVRPADCSGWICAPGCPGHFQFWLDLPGVGGRVRTIPASEEAESLIRDFGLAVED